MRREWWLVASLVATALLAACTHGGGGAGPPPRASVPAVPLAGTLILETGQSHDGVASYEPDTRTLTPIRGLPSQQFEFVSGAALTGPDAGVLMDGGHLFQLTGNRAAAVGPRLPTGFLVGLANGLAVASVCLPGERVTKFNRVAVLDPANPDAWRTVAKGCGAAVSPDGSEVAVTATALPQQSIFGGVGFTFGTKVWADPVDGNGPQRLLLDVTALPAVRAAMVAHPQVVHVAWGGPGLAVAVANGESGPWALVVVPASGPQVVVPLGQTEPFDLAWQPHGDLLAFTDCYQCTTFGRNPAHTADVRIYDSATGGLRQIAAASNQLSGLVWSPSGDVVATQTSDGVLLFVDTAGRTTVRRSIDGVPEDWAA